MLMNRRVYAACIAPTRTTQNEMKTSESGEFLNHVKKTFSFCLN